MDLWNAIQARHSVRQYTDAPLTEEQIALLRQEIDRCNREGALHIQLITNEPKAFAGPMAHYGSFRGVSNYFALVGKDQPGLEESCGYYGERLVLLCQALGLNTCWVALTYKRIPGTIAERPGERLTAVICVGVGRDPGVPHKSRSTEALSDYDGPRPDWFRRGMEAVLLAPTAVNQQRFHFSGKGNTVIARTTPTLCGKMAKIDLGIAKYHFEIGAGTENFLWG